jgi:hypothetical protein
MDSCARLKRCSGHHPSGEPRIGVSLRWQHVPRSRQSQRRERPTNCRVTGWLHERLDTERLPSMRRATVSEKTDDWTII